MTPEGREILALLLLPVLTVISLGFLARASWTPASTIGLFGHWAWRSRVGRGSTYSLRRRHDQAQANALRSRPPRNGS
jgi:hypothetical protein